MHGEEMKERNVQMKGLEHLNWVVTKGDSGSLKILRLRTKCGVSLTIRFFKYVT